MIAASILATSTSSLGDAEAGRMELYILSGVIGLVVTGLIACAKQIRAELVQRETLRRRINDISTR